MREYSGSRASKAKDHSLWLIALYFSCSPIVADDTFHVGDNKIQFSVGAGYSFTTIELKGNSNGFYSSQGSTSGLSLQLSATYADKIRGNLTYTDTSKLELQRDKTNTLYPDASAHYTLPALSLDWIFTDPGSNPRWYTRIGTAKTKAFVSNAPASIKLNSEYQLFLGAGLEVKLSERTQLRGSYEHISKDIQVSTLSVHYALGNTDRTHARQPNSTIEPEIGIDSSTTNRLIAPEKNENFCNKIADTQLTLYYDSNALDPQPESEALLQYALLNRNSVSSLHIDISAYTDAQSNRESNQQLSEQRAYALRELIVSKYAQRDWSFTTNGYGESSATSTYSSATVRAAERKATISISCEQPQYDAPSASIRELLGDFAEAEQITSANHAVDT